MVGYGLYSIVVGVTDLVSAHQLELVVDLALMVLGALLVVAAAFVRVQLPGGLALAIGLMLGLQTLAIHNTLHFYGSFVLAPQFARGIVALLLVALAFFGGRSASGGVGGTRR